MKVQYLKLLKSGNYDLLNHAIYFSKVDSNLLENEFIHYIDDLLKNLNKMEAEQQHLEYEQKWKGGCNFHKNCAEANRLAIESGKYCANHCRDEFCEDCFGQ